MWWEQEGEIYKKLQAEPRRLAKLQSSEIEKSIRYTKQRYDALGEKGKKSCSTHRQRRRQRQRQTERGKYAPTPFSSGAL